MKKCRDTYLRLLFEPIRCKYASLLLLCILLLASCGDELSHPVSHADEAELTQITTRRPTFQQQIIAGTLTLTLDGEKKANYRWSNDAFIFDSGDRILVGNGQYTVTITGTITMPYQNDISEDETEILPIAYSGPITTRVAADGSSASVADPIPLTIQTARFRLHPITGAFGEGILYADKVHRFTATLAEGIVTKPSQESVIRSWQYPINKWSYGNIAPGQTIAEGEELITLKYTGTDLRYSNLTFNVFAARDIEIVAGKQYTFNVTLDAGARRGSVTATIGNFEPGDPIGMKQRGITTPEDLKHFAEDWNKQDGSANKWFDQNGVVDLLNDIDMTGITDITSILNFDRTFAGGGHSIKNLTMPIGLFDIITEGGKVCALHLGRVDVAGNTAFGIARINQGSIVGCSISGEIKSDNDAGGIACINQGTIAGCYTNLTALTGDIRGAIAGKNESGGIITGCTYNNTIESSTVNAVGYQEVGSELYTTTAAPPDGGYPDYNQTVAMNTALLAHSVPHLPVQWVYSGPNDVHIQLPLTPDDEYGIRKDQDLRDFSASINAGVNNNTDWLRFCDAKGVFRVRKDIEMKNEQFTPVNSFTGTFDGGGYTISGLHVNVSGSGDAGLFGQVNQQGMVYGVRIKDASIRGFEAGGIVGDNKGTITACSFAGIVMSNGAAGSIVGSNWGTVVGCYSTAASVWADMYYGGIIGDNRNEFDCCFWLVGGGQPGNAAGMGNYGNNASFADIAGLNGYVGDMNNAIQNLVDGGKSIPYRWATGSDGNEPTLTKQ